MELFPELNTQRLKLRIITAQDIPSLVKYGNNEKIANRVLNMPYPYQEPDAVFRISYVHQGFKNKTRYAFGIIFKETGELIGEISLHLDKNIAQLAYWIGEPFLNKGIATEATRTIVKFGLENLGLDMIYADCYVENKASQKVLLNNRMKEAGITGNVAHYRFKKQELEEQSGAINN